MFLTFVVDNKNDIYILRGGYILSSTIKNNDYKHALILWRVSVINDIYSINVRMPLFLCWMWRGHDIVQLSYKIYTNGNKLIKIYVSIIFHGALFYCSILWFPFINCFAFGDIFDSRCTIGPMPTGIHPLIVSMLTS